VERLCDRLPRTLVHGDFVPKNFRVRHGGMGPSLVVFDWEVAGWGLPAADVAECADLTAYAATVGPAWPHLNDKDIGQLAFLGKVFRLVCALSWASVSLVSGRPRRGLVQLRVYRAGLAALLAADGWGS
jgi:Ser/Thr protein kinase RdoA (MazF antagonist)